MNSPPDPRTMQANAADPVDPLTISGLRAEMGLTLAEFGERIGLASRAQVSLLERGLAPCSLNVALAVEALAKGRIDAALLNADVRRARALVAGEDDAADVAARASMARGDGPHAAPANSDAADASSGKSGANSPVSDGAV